MTETELRLLKLNAKPPDLAGVLKDQPYLTYEDAADMYVSEVLGWLSKEGFVFKESVAGGWGGWPPEYLERVLAHARYRTALLSRQAYEALTGNRTGNGPAAIKAPELPPEVQEAQVARNRGMHAYMAAAMATKKGEPLV